ncbi:hypothetical protein PspS35_01095 [Pseudomonas sp. S35]|uniref:hypothetical protein n=1 Tax=Pseudomonas sp. S35 TaxID=1573719 RepID=UPI00132E9116|nr:hypothetical protein [Pseudomonas sp. S35]QHF42445.1 hypothetical protein PspS35_01095 [Pseudomonas sp. S35]
MNSKNTTQLPPLRIEEAKPPIPPSDDWLLSLKDVPGEGATVIIQPTKIGTSKDRLQIYIGGKVVVDVEFNNNPPQEIRARIPRDVLLRNLGVQTIHYMIRIGQGNGEMGESAKFQITH